MAKYVNLASYGVTGNPGTAVSPWSWDDIQLAGSVTGETVHLKGANFGSGSSGALQRIDDAAAYDKWDDGSMGTYVMEDISNAQSFIPPNNLYSANGLHADWWELGIPTELKSCFFHAGANNITFHDQIDSAAKVINVYGCTFQTSGAIIPMNYFTGTPTPITINFYSCVFDGAVFDSGTYATDTINCYNCTFLGKTQAQVTAAFSGTATFDSDCRFNRTLPSALPTTVNNYNYFNNKQSLIFDTYVDATDTLTGPGGYDYSTHGKGHFRGERRGVGAFWFPNTYYAEPSSATSLGTGDGLSYGNRMGWTDLNTFFGTGVVQGRQIREGDTFIMCGSWTPNGATVAFPTGQWGTTGFGADPDFYGYAAQPVTFRPYSDTIPFVLNVHDSTGSVTTWGMRTIFERFTVHMSDSDILRSEKMGDFYSCTFFNDTKVDIVFGDSNITGNLYMRFYGCLFATPRIDAACVNPIPANEIRFYWSSIPEFNSVAPLLYQGATTARVLMERCTVGNDQTSFTANFPTPANTYTSTLTNYSIQLWNALPTSFSSYATKENLDFYQYDLNGSLVTTGGWPSDIDEGPWGVSPRLGTGAFWMGGVVPTAQDYYADADAGAPGVGTEVSPWDETQLLAFAAGTLAPWVDDSSVSTKGVLQQTTTDHLIFAVTPGIEITFKGWNIQENGPWIIEVNNPGNPVNAFRFNAPATIIIEDVTVLAPTASCSGMAVAYCPGGYAFSDLKNSVVMSDVPTEMGDASNPTAIDVIGCIVSIGSNASTFEWGLNWFSTQLYDSVFHINSAVTISNSSSSTIDATRLETNRSSAAMLLDSQISCTFNNTDPDGPVKIPVSKTAATFTINDLIYANYVINNPGSGIAQWTIWDILTGIGGTGRQGIGAFFFATAMSYYADHTQIDEGAGTEEDPWNLFQFLTYFDANYGADIGTTVPVGGDFINVRGYATRELVNQWMTLDRSWFGDVTVRAWDIEAYGPWIAEIINNDSAPVNFIDVASTPGKLIMSDFIFLHDNEQTNQGAWLVYAENGQTDHVYVDFKNFMAFIKNEDTTGTKNDDATYGLGVTMRGFNMSSYRYDWTNTGGANLYDGALYFRVAGIVGTAGFVDLEHCEVNKKQSDFVAGYTFVNCTLESDAPTMLPDYFRPTDYDPYDFDYNLYEFANLGMGQSSWDTYGYSYGVTGESRMGLGFFFYFVPVPTPVTPDPKPTVPCEEPPMEGRSFWDWLTTFWGFLTDDDRDLFENFWAAMVFVGDSLLKKGLRFYEAQAPENARVCVLDDYYDVQVGPMHSKPINLDPTIKEPNYVVKPLRTLLVAPEYDGNNAPVYRHMMEITALDYYRLREVALDTYVVVHVKREGIADQYFRVNNLFSSEEPKARPSSCEIGSDFLQSIEIPTPSTYGTVRLTALDETEDVADYKVLFSTAGASSITWYTDGLDVVWDASDSIDDMVALINASDPNKWAKAENISPKDGVNFPSFGSSLTYPGDALPFDVFTSYVHFEEANGRYYPPSGLVWRYFEGYTETDGDPGTVGIGEYIPTQSKFQYMVEVQGDLTYIGIEAFTVYFTTGQAYDIQPQVLELPVLQNFIETGSGVLFRREVDYSFSYQTGILEFFQDLFAAGRATPDEYFYCSKTPLIEHYLFELYGDLTATPDWRKFNYDRFSGKAGVNAMLKGLQESSNRIEYERALNAYFGLPVAPENAEAIGLYETYGYEILAIDSTEVSLAIKDGSELHPFIQPGCRFFIDEKKNALVNLITSRSVLDATLGYKVAKVVMADVSHLAVGDELHLKLNNRLIIKDFTAETDTVPGYIWVYSPEGAGAIDHLIETTHATSNYTRYPEIVVFGTKELEYNFNGTYHITGTQQVGGLVRLTVYKSAEAVDPLYNDFIGQGATDIGAGFVHISWPTHKFLLLLLDVNQYVKAYLDAPIDTIYDNGDALVKYQTIARSVSVLTDEMFPGWTQFDNFRKFSGINIESDILELTNVIPGAKFGGYFPSGYEETQ